MAKQRAFSEQETDDAGMRHDIPLVTKESWCIFCNVEGEYYSMPQEDEPTECPNGHEDINVLGQQIPKNTGDSFDSTLWDQFFDDDGSTITAKREQGA